MSVPKIVKGQYFDVAVFAPAIGTSGQPGYVAADTDTPTIVCGLTTRNLTHQFNTSDEFIRDCADPTMVPFRVVNVTGEQFDISGTGLYNRSQGPLIRSLGGKSLKYRFIMGEPSDDAVDAGYFEGNFVLTNEQFGAPDGTNATSQFTFVSDGQVVWHPAS